MKFSQISSVVPKPVRVAAPLVVGCAALLGAVFGFLPGRESIPVGSPSFTVSGIVGALVSRLILGLLAGLLAAGWVFFLGYVYGDARRRNMPPILWTLVAALVPNLLGFLLYFAIRKPVAIPCPHCGRPLEQGGGFCSWCGKPSPFAAPAPSSLDTGATA